MSLSMEVSEGVMSAALGSPNVSMLPASWCTKVLGELHWASAETLCDVTSACGTAVWAILGVAADVAESATMAVL